MAGWSTQAQQTNSSQSLQHFLVSQTQSLAVSASGSTNLPPRAAQPHPAWEMTSEHDSACCARPAFTTLCPLLDYLQDLQAFNALILASFTKWHCPDELTSREMLGMFCCHSSEHTQGTHDRTFCQPCVRIFNHFHHVCLQNWNTSGTKIKNCSCKRHWNVGFAFCWQCKIVCQDEHTNPQPPARVPEGLSQFQQLRPGQNRARDRRCPGRQAERLCQLSSAIYSF